MGWAGAPLGWVGVWGYGAYVRRKCLPYHTHPVSRILRVRGFGLSHLDAPVRSLLTSELMNRINRHRGHHDVSAGGYSRLRSAEAGAHRAFRQLTSRRARPSKAAALQKGVLQLVPLDLSGGITGERYAPSPQRPTFAAAPRRRPLSCPHSTARARRPSQRRCAAPRQRSKGSARGRLPRGRRARSRK